MPVIPDWARDPRLSDLDAYRVGGAIRDELLGLTPTEHDFVIVGASPEQMRERSFRPVGRDFPVFLHPDTHEEFALARTERKSGPGYRGFEFHTGPEVSLADDLARRDLTINAIAEDRAGVLIDPFGGRGDLDCKTLRHVSEAFVEDPVRLLRLARFATRLEDFEIAPATLTLCRKLVASGEVDHLVPERVWQEMSRALMHARPSRFFQVLRETGALARILPELDALWGVPQVPAYHPEIDTGEHVMLVLDEAARMQAGLDVRFACLVHDLGKALTPAESLPKHHGHEKAGLGPVEDVCRRLKVSNETRELALLVCEFHLVCHRAAELNPGTVMRLLKRSDALRRPERFEYFLQACEADKRGRKGRADQSYPAADLLRRARAAAAGTTTAPLRQQGLTGKALGEALERARIRAIATVMNES